MSLGEKGIKFGAPNPMKGAKSYFNNRHLQAMQPPQPDPHFVRRLVQQKIKQAHFFEESYENIVQRHLRAKSLARLEKEAERRTRRDHHHLFEVSYENFLQRKAREVKEAEGKVHLFEESYENIV